MARNTSIAWTQATWNPWHGCLKVSPGCKNCYMYQGKTRFGQNPSHVVRSQTTFHDPLHWPEPRLIFACSWSDWFIDQADAWRKDAWDVIRRTPRHTYQILTKRPERIASRLPQDWGDGWTNVWLGVTIEAQQYVYRKNILTSIPCPTRFICAEPLLGAIDLGPLAQIHWVLTGGETGPHARPTDPDWIRSIRDQCLESNVPFFHIQHGGTKRIDGAWGGRLIDGVIWDQMPGFAAFNNYQPD